MTSIATAFTPASYWMESAPGPRYPALEPGGPALEVDAAVVGGGVAGICTAWELARAGRSVALVEADRLASGVTGHTTAKVSALQGLAYQRIRDARGEDAARAYAASQADAVARVRRACAELAIDCDLEEAPAYTYAQEAEALGAVRAEAAAAADAGLDASFVTATDLPFPVAGAVRVPGQAQFHPRRYLLALAADAAARGARVVEHSRVTALHEGDPCRIVTEAGAEVRARDVVVATHYPVFDRGLLFARLTPRRELVVAAVLPAGGAPRGMYLTPEQGTRSVRTAPYGDGRRLLVVTGEKFAPGAGGVTARFERLAAWTRDRFPDAEPAFRWSAQDTWTPDRLPYVGALHRASRHAWVATGFAGWGMTGGVLAGALLAGRLTGSPPPWADLYDPGRRNPVREAPALLKQQAEVARHFLGDRLSSGGGADAARAVPRGGGTVVRVGGRQRAVFRDEAGALHALSARCTHLGCLVQFNDADRTWECPCHGSRFGTDGAVLEGPATRPLERCDDPPADDPPADGADGQGTGGQGADGTGAGSGGER
ncbi:FAD-dependent oxidoreductase [Streptomyces sp. B1866]|uniref:FAD-dependent oxidoreductase n=1 Tax=Streptomyces sp. B1866 TaxID=3075431 RepID=UPI0028926D9E|nr:FAD-dependent oxidoreductase [Streptomyces sp. B1866]MDT3400617.1 FAD-dependent oxidoreductase [Streptomyces sp. B1866]